MYSEKRLMFLIAETPVHVGSGSDVGLVDLPIQRERHTEFPKIESSGLKGCLREIIEKSNKEVELQNGKKLRVNETIRYKSNGSERKSSYISLIFGSETAEDSHAGAMSVVDARILLYPVKSLKGVFAWITCPSVLERFKKDLRILNPEEDLGLPENMAHLVNTIPPDSKITVKDTQVVLEEYTFSMKKNENTKKMASWLAEKIYPTDKVYDFWREKLQNSLVILSDDDFTYFVKTSTEVITRTKINEVTGTVEAGALWTEEYLPQDSILYSMVFFTSCRVENEEQKGVLKGESVKKEAELLREIFEKSLPDVIQIGGNQTIGKGFMRLNILKV